MALAGVAISTTGDEHRLAFLETGVAHWSRAGFSPLVTVDGDSHAARIVRARLPETVPVYWLGADRRLGVAANKNAGLEVLMDSGCEHLFLSDDDTWPLGAEGPQLHTALADAAPHSMVCWGSHRKPAVRVGGHVQPRPVATWVWPRGVVLYQTRLVVDTIGGMDERFGPGGHEHVEYSRRAHQRGLTTDTFTSPAEYARLNGMGARVFWHGEDMPRPGEPLGNLRVRRRRLTSVRRQDGDWTRIEQIMRERDGDTAFVPYRAAQNGRAQVTVWEDTSQNLTGRGADG